MKATKQIMVLGAAYVLACHAYRADGSMNDEFISLYGMLGSVDVSQETFLEDAARGGKHWYGYYLNSRTNISNAAICEWYCGMTGATIPGESSYWDRMKWLRTKSFAISEIGANDCAVQNNTNCWFAVSAEIGGLRNGFRSNAEWDALRGITSRTIDTNGIEFLCIADWSSPQAKAREVEVMTEIESEKLYKNFVIETLPVLGSFSKSEALASFPLDQRNAIVSNIVETARLTAEESAALGLTNIVEQTGEP